MRVQKGILKRLIDEKKKAFSVKQSISRFWSDGCSRNVEIQGGGDKKQLN